MDATKTYFIISIITLFLSILLCIRGIRGIEPQKLCEKQLNNNEKRGKEEKENEKEKIEEEKDRDKEVERERSQSPNTITISMTNIGNNINGSFDNMNNNNNNNNNNINKDTSITPNLSANVSFTENTSFANSHPSAVQRMHSMNSSMNSMTQNEGEYNVPKQLSTSTISTRSLNPNASTSNILSTSTSTATATTTGTATATASTSGSMSGRSVTGSTNDKSHRIEKYARREKHKESQDYYYRLVSLCIVILTVLSIGCTTLFFGWSSILSKEERQERNGWIFDIVQIFFLLCHFACQIFIFALFSGKTLWQTNHGTSVRQFGGLFIFLGIFALISISGNIFVIIIDKYNSKNNTFSEKEIVWNKCIFFNLFHFVYLFCLIYRARIFAVYEMADSIKQKKKRIKKQKKKLKHYKNYSSYNYSKSRLSRGSKSKSKSKSQSRSKEIENIMATKPLKDNDSNQINNNNNNNNGNFTNITPQASPTLEDDNNNSNDNNNNNNNNDNKKNNNYNSNNNYVINDIPSMIQIKKDLQVYAIGVMDTATTATEKTQTENDVNEMDEKVERKKLDKETENDNENENEIAKSDATLHAKKNVKHASHASTNASIKTSIKIKTSVEANTNVITNANPNLNPNINTNVNTTTNTNINTTNTNTNTNTNGRKISKNKRKGKKKDKDEEKGTYHVSLAVGTYNNNKNNNSKKKESESNKKLQENSKYSKLYQIDDDMVKQIDSLSRTSLLMTLIIFGMVTSISFSLYDICRNNSQSTNTTIVVIEIETLIDGICCLLMFPFSTFEYNLLCKCECNQNKNKNNKNNSKNNKNDKSSRGRRSSATKRRSRHLTDDYYFENDEIERECKFGCHYICQGICTARAMRQLSKI